MEATFNVPWERTPLSRRGDHHHRATMFARWMSACRNLGRFDGGVRARMLLLFLCTAAAFAVTTIVGAHHRSWVLPATWVLTSVADLVMIVGILAFVGKVGRETRTRAWGTFAAVAFLASMVLGTGQTLLEVVGVDVGTLVAGRSVSSGWLLLASHVALGVGLLASAKVLTNTAKALQAAVALSHARGARTLLSVALGAAVGTHLLHLFGTPRVEITAGAIGVALTLALVAGARLVGSVRHLRDAIEDALDAGVLGLPERWFESHAHA